MRAHLLVSLVVFTTAAPALAAKPAPATLHPSGPWSVEYAKEMCVLSRPFGTGKDRVLFAFKPAPNSDQARLMLIDEAGPESPGIGKADIRLSDGSRPAWATFRRASSKGTSLTAIDVPRSSLRPLVEGGSIAIRAGKKVNVVLAPTGMQKALTALAKCEADLLKQWGMNEAAQAALTTLPVDNVRKIFKADDYPDDLLENGVQGSVGILMTIDASGALKECRAIETSGTRALDDVTCSIIKKRARFEPARHRDGKPMASLTYQRISWMIADGYNYELNTDIGTPPSAPIRAVNER